MAENEFIEILKIKEKMINNLEEIVEYILINYPECREDIDEIVKRQNKEDEDAIR